MVGVPVITTAGVRPGATAGVVDTTADGVFVGSGPKSVGGSEAVGAIVGTRVIVGIGVAVASAPKSVGGNGVLFLF